MTGRLTEWPNTHGETRADAVPSTRAQRRQECRTTRPWDEGDLHRQRVQQMAAAATLGEGVLVLDETGCPTQGQAAVGVARQASGPLGHVGHCPGAVTWCDTAPQAMWPVAGRWYVPTPWAEDTEPRGKARVPAGMTCHTTPEMALSLRAHVRAWGGPHRGVVAEADDGDTPPVRAGWEARQQRHVVGGRADFRVSLQRQATPPSQRAARRLQTQPRWPWPTIRWRQGTQGWRRKRCVAVRCWRVTTAGQRHLGWLLGERATRGQPEERQDG